MNIEGAIVAITGAGRGLGAATARCLAARGAQLALIDYDRDSVVALSESLTETQSVPIGCDVSDEQAVEGAFAVIKAQFGGLDVLVNNAGITRDAMLLKYKDGRRIGRMSLDDWQAVIDVNLTGVFLCGREAAECMADRGGVVVNISSISRQGNMGQSNYSAAKAGVAALTVTWAKELARYGIRVNSISPGFINTEMVQAMKPEAVEKLQGMIPIGRVGEPDEIAQTVQFIIENDFINGRDLEIDGGMRL